jgi:endonuclease/exonuclease/phosphatase family metal-dependent hydrolase
MTGAGTGRRAVVASYNVHGFVGMDQRVDADRTGRVLAELAADVVALQEVRGVRRGAGALERLADALGMHAVAGPTLERGDATHGNALLLRWPPERVERIDLSLPGREPRAALDVSLVAEGEPLRVVATHLGIGARERRLQARRLAQHLGVAEEGVRILLGDMNEWARGVGALLVLHRVLGRAPGLRTFPAPFPLFALDRIWIDPRSRLRRLWVHRSSEAVLASDHLPIAAELDLRA